MLATLRAPKGHQAGLKVVWHHSCRLFLFLGGTTMFAFDAALGEDLAEDIFHAMRGDEKLFSRPLHRADCPYVQCRKTLVAWIIEVCEALGIGNVTTFHACDLMDRVFLFEGLNQKSAQPFFQLVAMVCIYVLFYSPSSRFCTICAIFFCLQVCIFIAAKYSETDDKLPSMAEINELSEVFCVFHPLDSSVSGRLFHHLFTEPLHPRPLPQGGNAGPQPLGLESNLPDPTMLPEVPPHQDLHREPPGRPRSVLRGRPAAGSRRAGNLFGWYWRSGRLFSGGRRKCAR